MTQVEWRHISTLSKERLSSVPMDRACMQLGCDLGCHVRISRLVDVVNFRGGTNPHPLFNNGRKNVDQFRESILVLPISLHTAAVSQIE
jgi:hypothetical protein